MIPNKFTDINNIVNQKEDALKEYIDDTTYSQQLVDVDVNFSDGSVKITKALAAQAKTAVEVRLNAVKEDTRARINQINDNFKQYYNDSSVADDGKSLAKVFFPETFNATEDWSDDLYLMFDDMINELQVEDIGNNVEQFITQVLPISEMEDEKKMGLFRSLTKFLFLKENTEETDNYYFKKYDIIKSFLKRGLHRSQYKEKVEEFLNKGIISGMFVLKDNWGTTGEYKLCKSSGSDKNGYKYELNQEDVYKFTPVDSRMLMFAKHKITWITEKINTTFSELLNLVVDEDGKPKKNAKYDIGMLKELATYLKDVGANEIKADDITLEGDDQDSPETDISDLWDIDGDVTIYESHAIPLIVSKNGNKVPYKCLITTVNLSEKTEDQFDMIAIGIQKTPYVAGNPYLITNFIEKDGDKGGMGLPEVVEPLQKMLNNFAGHSVDVLNLALWGIMIIDPDSFKDPSKLKEIAPRLIMQLKGLKGRRVEDVIQWMHPDLNTLSSMGEMFALFQDALRRTTRKGPTGEKVSPNPSATEFDSMITESQKSVNKVGLRVNNVFSKMLERMYIYNIMNIKGRAILNVQAYRIRGNDKAQVLAGIANGQVDERAYSMVDKSIELTPEELFIDGLNFILNAADTFNKKSVEKQQSMQITNMLFSNGSIIDPATGQPHIMVDETGQQVYISEYKITKRLLEIFDYDDVFEKIEGKEKQIPSNQGVVGPPPTPQGPATPPLSASVQPSDIAQQATTLNPGVNL